MADVPTRAAVGGGRAIDPFPKRHLVTVLFAVIESAAEVTVGTARLFAENHRWDVKQWQHTLGQLMDQLEHLSTKTLEARAALADRYDAAEGDHEVAQRAALAILRSVDPPAGPGS